MNNGHRHVVLDCGKTKNAAPYTMRLCGAICEGIIQQKEMDRTGLMMIGELKELEVGDEAPEGFTEPEHDEDEIEVEGIATDDVTGEPLDPKLVLEARGLEIKYIREMKLYTKVDRQECIKSGCKPITTRWIDVNKGDDGKPNYRSRLVGKESSDRDRRTIRSNSATGFPGKQIIMSADVSRAFFEAQAMRVVCV